MDKGLVYTNKFKKNLMTGIYNDNKSNNMWSRYRTHMQGREDKVDENSDQWTCLQLMQVYNSHEDKKEKNCKVEKKNQEKSYEKHHQTSRSVYNLKLHTLE